MTASAISEPAELELAEARAPCRRTTATTRSCGRRCISSSPIPPSIAAAGSRTWSVRRPARTNSEVHEAERARGRRAGHAGPGGAKSRPSGAAPASTRRAEPLGRAERRRADDHRQGDEREQGELRRPRAGADRRNSRRAVGPGRRRSRATPVEPEPDLADLELVAEPERRDALDGHAVDERAVGALEVLDVPGAARGT